MALSEKVLQEFLERGVTALEALAQDPVIQMETGPPVCPHCGRENPIVRVEESTATGLLAEIVIQGHCQHCNQVFYGIPLQWACVKTPTAAAQVMQERAEISGHGNNG